MTWPGEPAYTPAITWQANVTKLSANNMNTMTNDLANLSMQVGQSVIDHLTPEIQGQQTLAIAMVMGMAMR